MLWSALSDKLGISTCIESMLSSLPFSSVKLLSNWGWVVKRPACACRLAVVPVTSHVSYLLQKYKTGLRDKPSKYEISAIKKEEKQWYRYGKHVKSESKGMENKRISLLPCFKFYTVLHNRGSCNLPHFSYVFILWCRTVDHVWLGLLVPIKEELNAVDSNDAVYVTMMCFQLCGNSLDKLLSLHKASSIKIACGRTQLPYTEPWPQPHPLPLVWTDMPRRYYPTLAPDLTNVLVPIWMGANLCCKVPKSCGKLSKSGTY